jgi:glutamine cyclotransferase
MKPSARWVLCLLILAGCSRNPPAASAAGHAAPAETAPPPKAYTYEVVNVFPHDRSAFTEGLIFLRESCLKAPD